jgi:hypothetical protein
MNESLLNLQAIPIPSPYLEYRVEFLLPEETAQRQRITYRSVRGKRLETNTIDSSPKTVDLSKVIFG